MRHIPFARPYVGKEEARQVSKAVKSGWLTTGKLTCQFEKNFQKYISINQSKEIHCLAVNSATAGLHLVLEAAGIKKGDKVITSPYTFTATAEVIRYLGAKPLFVDTIPGTPLIDPEKIEQLAIADSSIKAVIPIHIAGEACNMSAIIKICKKYNLFCLEDAAHALPAKNDGVMLGTQADAGVFSFYATKTVTTGEGGMIVTASTKLAKRISQMRLHGINRVAWDRYSNSKANWEYDIVGPGFKYNMPDTSAAIGIVQLKKADKMAFMRNKIANNYIQNFADLRNIATPIAAKDHSWHLFLMRTKDQGSTKKNIEYRNQWVEKLSSLGIGCSVHYKPLHLMSYYKEKYHLKPDDFPSSLEFYSRTFSIPIFAGMKKSDIRYIIKIITKLDKNGI